MVQLTRIYTRGGDKGKTSLGGGERVLKSDQRIIAIGTVDETNAALGVACLHVEQGFQPLLKRLQNDLFDLGADLCVLEDSPTKLKITDSQVTFLEHEIDRLNKELTPLTSFVLPGGTPAAAYLHLARTIARRTERDVVKLSDTQSVNGAVIRYLNRLSDLLFVLARYLNKKGTADILWQPGANRGEQ